MDSKIAKEGSASRQLLCDGLHLGQVVCLHLLTSICLASGTLAGPRSRFVWNPKDSLLARA